jgi:hypothetical protein
MEYSVAVMETCNLILKFKTIIAIEVTRVKLYLIILGLDSELPNKRAETASDKF